MARQSQQSQPQAGPAINSASRQRRQTAGAACSARDQAAMTLPALNHELRELPATGQAIQPGYEGSMR